MIPPRAAVTRALAAAACAAALVAGCGPAADAPHSPAATRAGTSARPDAPVVDAPAPVASAQAGEQSAPRGVAAPVDTLDAVARPDDTFETLLARHGAGSLVRQTLPGAEGETFEGWVLFADDPARRVEIVPDEAARHPTLVVVRQGSTRRRADGVRIGIDTRELERLNGRPFAFAGFDWDYGGLVMDWKGGRLDPGRFAGPVRLCPPDTRPDDYPHGDGEFMSSTPVVQRHPAIVCEVGVALDAD
ncbi:hypothetical protein [Lysobacter humi (ex Lee et al. 2017)]